MNTLFRKLDDLGREQPPLAELGGTRYYASGVCSLFVDVAEGDEVAELRARAVELRYPFVDEPIGHPGEEVGDVLLRQVHRLLVVPVDESLHEEGQQQRRGNLDALFGKDADHVLVGKGVELQENLAHYAYAGARFVEADAVEIPGGPGCIFDQQRRRVVEDRLLGHGQILVAQTGCGSRLPFPYDRGVVELGDGIGVEQGIEGYRQYLAPLQFESLLFVYGLSSQPQRDDRHMAEPGIEHGPLDKGQVVGGAALSAGLGLGRRAGGRGRIAPIPVP